MTVLKRTLALIGCREARVSWQGIAAALAAAVLLSGCYSLQQAFVFNNLYNSRQSVDELVHDPKTPPELREKLGWAQKILHFAKQSGLRAEGAYRYYIATDEPVVSYLVQAAETDRFEFVTWWFPFVGRVPYLGFFDKDKRDAEAAALEAKGYDVAKSGVGAFSSLGWFEDPIYTSMLDNSEAGLAHLLFHELVHRTFWSRGSAEFNENLAEFFGILLMERYLKAKHMDEALRHDRDVRSDRALLTAWIKSMKDDLEKLYAQGDSKERILAEKARIIAHYRQEKMPAFKTADFAYVREKTWNNASILGASLYLPDMVAFEKAFACYGREDVGGFLKRLAEQEEETGDAVQALARFCPSS